MLQTKINDRLKFSVKIFRIKRVDFNPVNIATRIDVGPILNRRMHHRMDIGPMSIGVVLHGSDDAHFI